MSFSRVGDNLSERLRTLKHFHTNQKNIWDIGCDHGHLGLSFLESDVDSIQLVDPAKPVIETLINKLKDSYITKGKVFLHHKEGQNLIIDRSSNCIFIAGMGGNEIGQIILNLLPQLDSTSRIVISPHRKILELRAVLKELPLTLLEETVLWEEGHFYQILVLRPGTGDKVSSYGEKLWESETGEAYREHQIKYFSLHQGLASQNYVTYLKSRNPLKLSPK